MSPEQIREIVVIVVHPCQVFFLAFRSRNTVTRGV